MIQHAKNTDAGHGSHGTKKTAWLGWGIAVLFVGLAWFAAIQKRGGVGTEPISMPGWSAGMDAGQAKAQELDRPMVVLFTADWCGPCQQLKKNVLTTPEVDAALGAGFVPVIVDLTDTSTGSPDAAAAQRYGVRGIPTVIAMRPDGEPIASFNGERSVAGFNRWLGGIE